MTPTTHRDRRNSVNICVNRLIAHASYGIRNAPGIFASRVASIALWAFARFTRCPSVVCFPVFTHSGRLEAS